MSLVEVASVLEILASVPLTYIDGSTKEALIYHSTEGGTLTLWSVDPRTSSKFKITPGPVEQVAEPRHDSNTVFYTKDVAKGAELHKVYRADALAGKESLAVDTPPMRVEGLATDGGMVAFTGATKDEMALYTSESGSWERRQRVHPSAVLSDASRDLLVGSGNLAGDARSYELFVFDLSANELREYTPKKGSVNKYPKVRGERILFESDYTGKNRLHVYDVETKEVSVAPCAFHDYLSYDAAEHPYFGWTDTGEIWFVGKRDGEARAFVSGKEIPTPPGYLWGLALMGNKAYVSHTTVVQPMRVMEVDRETGGSKVVVDNPPPAALAQKLGRARFIRYNSFDGRSIPALVVDHGSPRRTIVYVHGGPWAENENTWGIIMGSIVASGYNLIAPNFRGSTGYGEDYRNLDIGDPGGGDLQDVVYAARWALQNNLATETAIMGGSYGGYATLLALGKEPLLWSCGVAIAPVADWKEMHEHGDALYRDFVEELFDRKMELLPERSPSTYVKNVKRPVCIITSQNDSRTPIGPVLKYVVELANQSAAFELHTVPDLGHKIGTTRGLIDILYPGILFLQRRFPA